MKRNTRLGNEYTPLIIEFTDSEAEAADCDDCEVVAAEDLAENCLLRCVLMPFAMCSSRTCILTSLRFTKVESPVRLRTLVRILLNMLNNLSQEAELAETDRMRLANTMNGEVAVEWPGTVNDV